MEFKSACIGTTIALESLSYWAAADDSGRAGVVIASDVAKYPLGSSGEYTQGAGSVSLLVKKNPRIASLERDISMLYQETKNDFFRPISCTTATVNGEHSNQCSPTASMQGAFASYPPGRSKGSDQSKKWRIRRLISSTICSFISPIQEWWSMHLAPSSARTGRTAAGGRR